MRNLIINLAIAATIAGFFLGAIARAGAGPQAGAYASPAAGQQSLQPIW
jgi:hypothetical protein